MRAFAVAGKAFTTNASPGPLAMYRNDIRNAYVVQPTRTAPPDEHPTFRKPTQVEVVIEFYFKRPASHYNSAGELKNGTYTTPAPKWVIKKPDIDKVTRAVLDALTGFAYDDDSQVVVLKALKLYAETDSTYITIEDIP